MPSGEGGDRVIWGILDAFEPDALLVFQLRGITLEEMASHERGFPGYVKDAGGLLSMIDSNGGMIGDIQSNGGLERLLGEDSPYLKLLVDGSTLAIFDTDGLVTDAIIDAGGLDELLEDDSTLLGLIEAHGGLFVWLKTDGGMLGLMSGDAETLCILDVDSGEPTEYMEATK